MLMTHVTSPRYVGVAPGTTTMSLGAHEVQPAGVIPVPIHQAPFPAPTGDYYPRIPWLTKAMWVANPNIDNIQMLLPPNQWVTGPLDRGIDVPAGLRTMGPHPTDLQISAMRPYLPVHRGMINTEQGKIAHLGQLSTGERWAIFASVISSFALATTAFIAYAGYRSRK